MFGYPLYRNPLQNYYDKLTKRVSILKKMQKNAKNAVFFVEGAEWRVATNRDMATQGMESPKHSFRKKTTDYSGRKTYSEPKLRPFSSKSNP